MDEEERTKEQKEIDKEIEFFKKEATKGNAFAIEFFKKEATKGNAFAKDMVNHYKNSDNNNKKDSDFFEMIFGLAGVLFGLAGVLLVIFVLGVIIFAVIKWAFQMVF